MSYPQEGPVRFCETQSVVAVILWDMDCDRVMEPDVQFVATPLPAADRDTVLPDFAGFRSGEDGVQPTRVNDRGRLALPNVRLKTLPG